MLLVLRALGLWVTQTLRGLFPRRRIWRFVQASRRPWVIGLELAALAVLWVFGAVQPGHLAAGGIVGAALALNFWDEL